MNKTKSESRPTSRPRHRAPTFSGVYDSCVNMCMTPCMLFRKQDIALFHEHITALVALPSDTKWITFGGSYPGMLAAWARSKFGHLFHAAVSSSSPVEAILDMQGYNDVTVSLASRIASSRIHTCVTYHELNESSEYQQRTPLAVFKTPCNVWASSNELCV